MKHLKIIFNALWGSLSLLSLLYAPPAYAQSRELLDMDSVEISLLTCQPHDEIYSLYGHTAIRYRDLRSGGVDAAFNYGVFDFKKPHFVMRFVFGLTDYELGAFPFRLFCAEYRHFGSMVVEQVLNLTREEKLELRRALGRNLEPDNRVYRYNYFYNNCTTKARDIIEQCVNGKIEYAGSEDDTPTYRELVHSMTRDNPWSRFGNDFLLGIQADRPTDRRQREFLPDNLMYDFDHAQIYLNGQYRPLVKERRLAVPGGVRLVQQAFPLQPSQCAWLLIAAGIAIFLLEYRSRRSFLLWDVLLMAVTGTLGILLTLMLFSQHPTVSVNLQIALFNPLPWFCLWNVVRRRPTHYWHITAILCVLFLLGSFFQHYPEGIYALALCLLMQCYVNSKFSMVKR